MQRDFCYAAEKIKSKNKKAQEVKRTDASRLEALTPLCLPEMTAVICMGVCRVRDGGGEKRGKKREFRGNGRVNEKRGRKIYVR